MAHLIAKDVSIEYPLYRDAGRSLKRSVLPDIMGGKLRRGAGDRAYVTALRGIDLELRSGDRLAIMGQNGSGKTTLLKVLAGVYRPAQGLVEHEGRRASLLNPFVGLNADATGRENVLLMAINIMVRPDEIVRHMDDIAAWSELGRYLDLPMRTYSSGMIVRLVVATYTCIRPEILLMDEWLTVADAGFVAKAEARLRDFVSQTSILVLASHSIPVLENLCNRAILLHQGAVVASGTVRHVAAAHSALIAAGHT